MCENFKKSEFVFTMKDTLGDNTFFLRDANK